MNRKNKLRKILEALTPDRTSVDFSAFDESINRLKEGLKEKIQVQTITDVQAQLEKFRKRIDVNPLFNALEDLKRSLESSDADLKERLNQRFQDLQGALAQADRDSEQQFTMVSAELDDVRSQISALDRKEIVFPKQHDYGPQIAEVEGRLTEMVATMQQNIENDTEAEELAQKLEKLRVDLTNRINSIPRGGGNQNRRISVGGNPSVLSKYDDINIKAGSNVTITYANNNTTKQVDITFSSSGGGGGSVGGTVRSINTIDTSQTAGDASGTDYVYLCTQGVRLELPAATGNTNLYTIKNISNSSVLVAGTVDDDPAGIIMPVKYTSVDVISDDTDWKIT